MVLGKKTNRKMIKLSLGVTEYSLGLREIEEAVVLNLGIRRRYVYCANLPLQGW